MKLRIIKIIDGVLGEPEISDIDYESYVTHLTVMNNFNYPFSDDGDEYGRTALLSSPNGKDHMVITEIPTQYGEL